MQLEIPHKIRLNDREEDADCQRARAAGRTTESPTPSEARARKDNTCAKTPLYIPGRDNAHNANFVESLSLSSLSPLTDDIDDSEDTRTISERDSLDEQRYTMCIYESGSINTSVYCRPLELIE